MLTNSSYEKELLAFALTRVEIDDGKVHYKDEPTDVYRKLSKALGVNFMCPGGSYRTDSDPVRMKNVIETLRNKWIGLYGNPLPEYYARVLPVDESRMGPDILRRKITKAICQLMGLTDDGFDGYSCSVRKTKYETNLRFSAGEARYHRMNKIWINNMIHQNSYFSYDYDEYDDDREETLSYFGFELSTPIANKVFKMCEALTPFTFDQRGEHGEIRRIPYGKSEEDPRWKIFESAMTNRDIPDSDPLKGRYLFYTKTKYGDMITIRVTADHNITEAMVDDLIKEMKDTWIKLKHRCKGCDECMGGWVEVMRKNPNRGLDSEDTSSSGEDSD